MKKYFYLLICMAMNVQAQTDDASGTLERDTIALQEVIVTSKKQFVEQQADKMVINPEASITTASDNILDVLAKSPGISVDKDGNIILKGKSGITVLIDDKPTYLNAEQLAAMLRNMQATSVERIEIIENPPAKYDAEGSAGIINIRTKRGKIRGLNGSLSGGFQMGETWSENAGLNLNYRDENLNIYGNYYHGIYNHKNSVDLTRKFLQGDGSEFRESATGEGRNDYNGLKIGADYYLNQNHILGIMGRVSEWTWNGKSPGTTDIIDASGDRLSRETNSNTDDNTGSNYSLNLNYKWTIDATGKNLSVDLDHAYYKHRSFADMNTTYDIPGQDSLKSRNDQSSYIRIYSVKADYEHPLNEKNKLDAGFKSSLVDIDSELNFTQFDYTNKRWHDPNKMSNRFKYAENINAVYASYKRKWSEKFDMQLGLRGEQTRSEGNNITIDSITNRNYFNLFPTLFLQESFSEKHQMNLSYAYRIGRPNYGLLNPFVWMLNPYTYNQGNPLLQPQFTHSIKWSYVYNQRYILSMGYAYTEDQYIQVFEQNDDTKVTVIAWRNLNNVNNADLTLTIPVQIKNKCQINTNMTTFYQQYKSPLSIGYLDRSRITFRGNVTASLSLPNNWSAEISGWYMSKMIHGIVDFNPMGSMSAGVQKLLFNKKASLKLSVSDIFKTEGQSYTSKFQNVDLTGFQEYDSRRVQLNFSWRFGKDNIKPARQRTSGLEEEAGRTGK